MTCVHNVIHKPIQITHIFRRFQVQCRPICCLVFLLQAIPTIYFFTVTYRIKLKNSGFSAEDLISNLISVYRSINPNINYIDHCKPVDKTTALQIWDNYGEIGNIKNSTLSPYLFPLNAKGKPEKGALPDFLNTINIRKAESLYEEVK